MGSLLVYIIINYTNASKLSRNYLSVDTGCAEVGTQENVSLFSQFFSDLCARALSSFQNFQRFLDVFRCYFVILFEKDTSQETLQKCFNRKNPSIGDACTPAIISQSPVINDSVFFLDLSPKTHGISTPCTCLLAR